MRLKTGLAICAMVLTGCGGGGSGGTSLAPVGWQSGVFKPASTFENRCTAPRTGVDPATKAAYLDRAGTLLDENNWLRSWSNDLYLWYSEISDQDPSLFAATSDYFKVLKTTAATASGAAKDKFHFEILTKDWYAQSQNNLQPGYGAQWEIVVRRPPREVRVAYTELGSWPATTAAANLLRGAEVLTVDNVDLVNGNTQADIDTINAGLFPANVGETHTFQILDFGAGAPRTVTLTSVNVTSQSVRDVKTLATANGTVGYMLFNDHLASSQAALLAAFTQLQAAGINDLVLDIRYNGGGYLDIASEVAFMIAGRAPTAGMTFELTQFNSKHPTIDPVGGQTITPTPFHDTTQKLSTTILGGQALPSLNLSRVFVLTGPGTCSASEAIINGLQGVGIAVIQIGSTTCGKPYGFYPQDNCGTTYFSIEFQGVNAMGQGGYTDGFTPSNTPLSVNANPERLTGCSVADDFAHAPGDPAEARLAAAIGYIAVQGACPAPSGLAKALRAQLSPVGDGLPLEPSPLRQLRIITR